MNRFSILFAFFSIGLSANAQQVTYQAAPNDIQQVVTNIFGLQCENIGTVGVQGVPLGFGIFSNGQAIGLNSGLVLSTGNLFNVSNQNATYFSNVGFGSAGDVDIDQLNTGALSYDALSIAFQFTPTITDTIRFKYVFASEEYPEYSTSNFNDRFLFLVSENNGPATNIAVIPGTSTVVQINSINQFVNSNFYIENTDQNYAFDKFVFDGYTVPMEAKFFATAGNTYSIKLVIADVADDVFDSAIFLDEQGSFSTISGELAIAGAPAQDGLIQVFDAAVDSTGVNPLYSIPVVNGSYVVDSVPSGNYHIRYLPDLATNPTALPSYFTNGTSWSTADLIGLPCYFNSMDLNSTSVQLNGPGSVSGTIFIDSSFQKSLALPYANAVVLLRDMQTGTIVDYTRSAANGNYAFSNLPFGTYQLLVDVPYMPQLDTVSFQISANSFYGGTIDHNIESDGIYSTYATLGLEQAELQFSISPNPAGNQLVVNIQHGDASQLQLIQLNGQVVLEEKINATLQKIDLTHVEAGMYVVKINNGGVSRTQKLVILH